MAGVRILCDKKTKLHGVRPSAVLFYFTLFYLITRVS